MIKPGVSSILCFCVLCSPSVTPGVLHYFFKLCSWMETLPLIGAFAFQTRLGLEITSPRWTTNPQPKMWKASSSAPCLNPSSHAALQLRMNCTALRIWWEAHLFFPQEFSVSCHGLEKEKLKSKTFKVKISIFSVSPVTHSRNSATHFSSVTCYPTCKVAYLFHLRGSVVVAEIVARYLEPFREKVLEPSVLAHELLKKVIPSFYLKPRLLKKSMQICCWNGFCLLLSNTVIF